MKLAIVIVTHNRAHKAWKLYTSIRNTVQQDHHIYMLDNATTQEVSAVKALKQQPHLTMHSSKTNLYPGAARNWLFNCIKDEDFVLTLDDDMVVTEGLVDALLEAYYQTDNCGGVGARILQEGTGKIHSQGGYYIIDNHKNIVFKENLRFAKHKKENKILECDWLASGCSLYPQFIIDKFRFDEALPCMEDPMHSYDIKQAGYKLVSTAAAEVVHSHGSTSNPNLRCKDNLIRSICHIHHKYGLNAIYSWNLENRILHRHLTTERMHDWLEENKVRFNIIKASEAKYMRKPATSDRKEKGVPGSKSTPPLRDPGKFLDHEKPLSKFNLSIIIPYRNRLEHIKRCLKQIEIQENFRRYNIETIVVNLASRKIEKNVPQDIREFSVSYIHAFSRAYACNIGVKQAKNDIIMLLDADCLMHPKMLINIEKSFDLKNPYFAMRIPVLNLDKKQTDSMLEKDIYSFSDFEKIYDASKINSASCSQIVMRRSTYIEIGGMDESYVGYGYEGRDLYDRIMSYFRGISNSETPIKNQIVLTHLHHPPMHDTLENRNYYNHNRRIYNINLKKREVFRNRGREWGTTKIFPELPPDPKRPKNVHPSVKKRAKIFPHTSKEAKYLRQR